MKKIVMFIYVIIIANHLSAQCTKDLECKGDRICVRGICVDPPRVKPKPCTKDVDCQGDSTCDRGRCVAAATPAPQSIGGNQSARDTGSAPQPNGRTVSQQPAQEPAPRFESKAGTIPVRIVSNGRWTSIKYLNQNTWYAIQAPCTLAMTSGNISWLLDSSIVTTNIKKPSLVTFSKSSSLKRIGGFTCMLVGVTGFGLMLAAANPESGLKIGIVPVIVIGGVGGGLMALGAGMVPRVQTDVTPWIDAPRFSIKPSIGIDQIRLCESRSMRFSLGASVLF